MEHFRSPRPRSRVKDGLRVRKLKTLTEVIRPDISISESFNIMPDSFVRSKDVGGLPLG